MGLEPQGRIELEGGSIEYRFASGAADAPVIVLLHEGLGSAAMWRDFPERLCKATGLCVFAYSRFGYGNSSSVDVPRPLSYMHDEAITVLPALLDAAGIEKCFLVGHSDGASIAAIHAGNVAGNRCLGLVLMAPHFFVEDVSVRSITLAREAYETGGLRERLKKYHGKNTDCAFWGWNRAWLDPEFRHWNIVDDLAFIRVPVQVIQGRDDEYGTLAHVETAAEEIPAPVDVRVLDDCGHAPWRDREDEVLAGISWFTERLTSTP